MKHITYPLFFFLLFLLLFFVWRMIFLPASSSLSYIVVPKNSEAIAMIDGVSGTLSAFPEKTFFAEKVANRYGDILMKEGFSSQESIVRKWHKRIKVENESHMITLRAFGHSNRDAEQLVRASANILEEYRRVYYGEGISLDLIASPLSETHSSWIGFWVSVLGALFGSGVLYFFLGREVEKKSLTKTLPLKKEEPYYRVYEEWAQEDKMEENVLERDPQEKDKKKESKDFSKEERMETVIAPQQKELESISPSQESSQHFGGMVPSNLPIAEIQETTNNTPNNTPHEEFLQEEPSNEEYKKRLNELLRGKMISLL
jgi:hypothetical protein